jgi:hypothetical protein
MTDRNANVTSITCRSRVGGLNLRHQWECGPVRASVCKISKLNTKSPPRNSEWPLDRKAVLGLWREMTLPTEQLPPDAQASGAQLSARVQGDSAPPAPLGGCSKNCDTVIAMLYDMLLATPRGYIASAIDNPTPRDVATWVGALRHCDTCETAFHSARQRMRVSENGRWYAVSALTQAGNMLAASTRKSG